MADAPQHPHIKEPAVAIYHASVKPLARATGRSSVAAAAYRSGTELADERTGEVHDYRRRSGVAASAVVLPSGASCDRQALWSAAERAERRKDARTAREWEIALPAELSAGSRQALAIEFAGWLAERYQVAVDVAVHEPSRRGDQRNHHAHLLCTTRTVTLDAGGLPVLGGKSTAEWDNKQRAKAGIGTSHDDIRAVREAWATLCNRALAEAGVAARVDHRSLAAQGIDRAPGVKLGVAAVAIQRRGAESVRVMVADGIRAANDERSAVVVDLEAARRARAAEEAAAVQPAPEPAPPRPRRVAGLGIGRQVLEAWRQLRPQPATPAPSRREWTLPAIRLAELDAEIEREAKRLEVMEKARERQRIALDAWKRSVDALRAEQARLGARLRSWLGLQSGRAETEARAAVQAAQRAGRAVGLIGGLVGLSMPKDPPERAEIERRLVELRKERVGVIVEAEAFDRRQASAADAVARFVERAAAVVPAEQRGEWAALRALDTVDGDPSRLRQWLLRDGGMLAALAVERERRTVELEQLEQDLERLVRHDQVDDQAADDYPTPGAY